VRINQQGKVAAPLSADLQRRDRRGCTGVVGDALERLAKPLPKVAALLEEAEDDLLALLEARRASSRHRSRGSLPPRA
jgi:hypothetical protein